MSQRAVFGPSTGKPIAVVREHGSRVECVALVPWLVGLLLDSIGDYWLSEHQHRRDDSPEWRTMDTLKPRRHAIPVISSFLPVQHIWNYATPSARAFAANEHVSLSTPTPKDTP